MGCKWYGNLWQNFVIVMRQAEWVCTSCCLLPDILPVARWIKAIMLTKVDSSALIIRSYVYFEAEIFKKMITKINLDIASLNCLFFRDKSRNGIILVTNLYKRKSDPSNFCLIISVIVGMVCFNLPHANAPFTPMGQNMPCYHRGGYFSMMVGNMPTTHQ